MNPPICPVHNKPMHLLTGCHRESGGFVDNYWYCGEKMTKYVNDLPFECRCGYTVPARNREEAEEQSELQNRCDKECEEIENTCGCKAGHERRVTEKGTYALKYYYICNKCGERTREFFA